MKKFERDGKVAIILSTGFGTGWSTWGEEHGESLLFDSEIVQMLLDEKPLNSILEFAQEKYENDSITRGVTGLRIEWINKGETFLVRDFSGTELVQFMSELEWRTA